MKRDPVEIEDEFEFINKIDIDVDHESMKEEWTYKHDLCVASICDGEYHAITVNFWAQVIRGDGDYSPPVIEIGPGDY